MMTVLAVLLGMAVLAIVALALGVRRLRARTRGLEHLLADTNARLEHLQIHFSRFAPSDVVERLTEPEVSLPPNRRQVAVLFADIRGFTAMCQVMDPGVTVNILNGYFQAMSEVIADHHGRVTELIGDGLLALFGALETNPWQARDAVQAGLAMREALAAYNASLREQHLPQLSFGIGIHVGEVLAGVMGNQELSKFAVVGDTINLAARVEGLTRDHGVDLLITDQVRLALNERFVLREMPAVTVKGKTDPLVTYWVEGPVG